MKLLAALLALILASCATTEPMEWSAAAPGCYNKGVADAFWVPDDMGLTDIRIGRLPDTGQGPGLMVHFRRHLDGVLGESTGKPDLLLAVGAWQSSCVTIVQRSDCPQAEAIYSGLASESIPIGHAFKDPGGITILHGTQYFLSTRDGEGNQSNWSYYGRGHPGCLCKARGHCVPGGALTIHSSRSRFAARLNSGVRPAWKLSGAPRI